MAELFNNTPAASFAEVLGAVNSTAAASPEAGAEQQPVAPQQAAADFLNDGNFQDVTANPEGTYFDMPGGQQQTQSQNIGQYIPASVAVELFDSVMTKVVLMAGKAMKLDISKSEAKATAEEKRMLTQPMEEVLKASNIRISNPFEAFAFAAVTIYGGKLMMVYFSNAFEQAEEVEPTDSDLNVVAQKAKRKNKPGAGRPRKNAAL